ncbi:hypothetical protein OS493_024872 [Desmophyllum pertusum]|uniref:Uncharacterized protein n=1 Tax=Desmophyllum pertusum TaxID=174260 RepID=A0A9X0CPR7_9CNID|nr:hypothetical protein OS493_024872 [Desmophyllum pertusum]
MCLKGMRSSSGSGHLEARNFEKKETSKPSDSRVQDDRRMDESGMKKSPQGRAHQDESEFRRFPSQSESLQFTTSRGSSPKVIQHKHSPEEPPEKKSRADDAYEREREMERLKYKREEEFLQKQKHLQQISMFKQLENDLQNKQLGGNFPRKQQTTPEKSERHGHSREDERVENRAGSARELIHHRAQESSTSTVKSAHHSFEAENSHISSPGQGSPRGHVIKSQSLSAPRSPRPSRSPVPASRYKENSSAADEKRDGSHSHPANFMPTQFQAYLSQLNFDPSQGQLPYGAHQMLVGPQFSLPPGLVMSMPITSHGESSIVTSMASASREREARSPYRSTERDRSSTSTSHSNISQSRMSTSESHERLQRLKDSAEKEMRRSPVMYQEERARNRSTASEQNVSPKVSSRTSDFKGEDNSLHAHPSIISNNLAISRMAGHHMDVLTEDEIIRRQRIAAEYSDPSQAMRMGYYVSPGLIGQLDPAYASMMQSSQHIGRGVEHYMAKRQ